jgi:hypothetical protein
MARIIDLDAARAARAETIKEAPVIKLQGKEFKLPNELPWSIVEAATTQDAAEIMKAVKSLLGEQWDEFQKLGVSVADMQILIENIATTYGVDQGN